MAVEEVELITEHDELRLILANPIPDNAIISLSIVFDGKMGEDVRCARCYAFRAHLC
jgi:hypothetical protein